MTSRTITISATGRCEAVPERASVEVTALGEGNSAAAARATARDHTAVIREGLTAVSETEIQTVELRVENTAKLFEPDTDADFQATERLTIDCKPESVETVVMDATSAGGTVQTVQFHFHEESRQRLQREALAVAMECARKKADCIAAAEDFVAGDVVRVETTEASGGIESIVDEALASNPDTDFHPSPVTVSEGVEVVYEISNQETDDG